MRSLPMPRFRRAVFVLVAASALAAAMVVRSAAVASTGPNIAYDELTKFVRGDQAAPQPGSFSADFQAAVAAAATPVPQHHGLFSGLQNAVEQAKHMTDAFTNGMASHVYYMNGWKRTDDLTAQTATIERPDRHEIIYLDLAKKTYHIVDTNAVTPTGTPPPYQPPTQSGPPPSPQPGTGKLDITVSSTSLGPKTLEGVATNGYSEEFKLVSSQSTGSCRDGSIQTTSTEYLSSMPEPQLAPMPHAMGPKISMSSIPPAAMMGVHPGCSPKITSHTSGGVSAPSDRFAMWMFLQFAGSAGGQGGSVGTLVERGDVRTLAPTDAALFDVPAGFTQEATQ